MKRRVPASEGTRKRIEDLISGESGKTERSDLVKLAAQLIIEEALEGEVQGVLGREHYARGGDVVGHRNGYRRGKLDTAEGRIEYAVPPSARDRRMAQRRARGAVGSQRGAGAAGDRDVRARAVGEGHRSGVRR